MYILSFLSHWNGGSICNRIVFCAGDCLTELKQLHIIVCLDITIVLAASSHHKYRIPNSNLALLQSSILTTLEPTLLSLHGNLCLVWHG